MALKKEQHFFKGLQRDLSVSKFNPEYAFDAQNIRITARDNNTLLTVTNERGNKEIPLQSPSGDPVVIDGILLGQNVLNNYVTLFTKGTKDNIYRLENKGTYFETLLLFSGNLNFSTDYPIENIGVYENDNIQKIYWVDGLNQPRVINIVSDSTTIEEWNNSSFDFIPELKLDETITVTSNLKVASKFPSGVVQYAFTYYNRNGSESNIIYQTPIYYTHASNRGGSPEEIGSNSFDIVISNPDTNFDYIRIYSRTSIDSTPVVRRVADLDVIGSVIRYTDNNTTGSSVDSTLLLYIGGEEIIPHTMTQKDNTLFLGNIHIKTLLFSKEARESVKGSVVFGNKLLDTGERTNLTYDYKTQLNNNSYQITSFKRGETYRFGVQFQNKKGKWSEVLYIGDSKVDTYPNVDSNNLSGTVKLSLVKPYYTIPKSVLDEAKALGYIKARGMIVVPTNSDRTILCQGVVCPTLWTNLDRESNSPYAVSSWFFRPFVDEANRDDSDDVKANNGTYAQYVDYDSINPVYPDRTTEIGVETLKTLAEGSTEVNDYLVDSSILTFHSPDIEFGDINTANINLGCQFIGSVALHSGISYRSVLAESTGVQPTLDYGFYNKFPQYERQTVFSTNKGGRLLSSGYHWMGIPLLTNDTQKAYKSNWAWLVSPWQRQGSLINDFRYEGNTYSNLKSNKLGNLRTSYSTYFTLGLTESWVPPAGISNVEIVDSNEVTAISIVRNDESLLYYGNVDKVIPPGSKTEGVGSDIGVVTNSYENIKTINQLYNGESENTTFVDKITIPVLGTVNLKDSERYTNSPVSIKYKSGKHAVFALNKQNGNRVIIPNSNTNHDHTKDSSAIFSTFSTGYSGLWLVELTQTIDEDNRFGGKTEEALLNNRWIVSGDPIDINDSSRIEFLQGDTYLQRYDCLKTYPFTLEDMNTVVEMVSFYCETHINIDGRYDRNRGNVTNLAITPSIFNLYNPIYSQSNNYFTYQYLNEISSLNDFPNSITWTEEKILGNEVDNWTKINVATTLDLDGDKGEVTSLNTYNNEIFCFQRRGLSNILFNSRVQIPTSDGLPIEITNGLKVSGKRYISNTIGCTNKWSIAESPSGLYFIDNETNSLYLFNGEIVSLSDKLGFRQWISAHNVHVDWEPVGYNNYRSFYDKNNNDVYFTYKDHCLCYSELINQFTSFMSYERVPAMFNVSSEFYAFKDGKMWEQFAGDYNMFFGEYKPFSITFVANAEEPNDKIFNTVEFRADSWDGDNLMSNKTFDTLDVWNEYQHGTTLLTNLLGHPSPLKKKFRVWRANIPRAIVNNRDRIRNTWAYIKLGMNTPNTYRTEFHDAIIHYFA
mgnify:CR=1 FL=1|jgi:hypothetical protein